jgi:putative aldouronate transport system permease protein
MAVRMKTRGDRVFDCVNTFLLIIVAFIMLYPMYFTVVASLSDPNETQLGHTFLFIKGLNFDAYYNVFNNKDIWTGYGNSIFITLTGTLLALCVTIPAAYALSRKYLVGRNILMVFFLITMYFSGGLIPSYLVNKTLHLVNTLAVLIIGGAFSVYNMIIVRTFYTTNFPDEIYEAAKIDGSSEIGIFFGMALPLSGAIIAVIALYVAVGHWNSYFGALIYLSDKQKWPLQLILRSILIQNQGSGIDMDRLKTASSDELATMLKKQQLAEAMKYSLIFISSLPMLIAYPFVQKYFVKGVMIGSVKG